MYNSSFNMIRSLQHNFLILELIGRAIPGLFYNKMTLKLCHYLGLFKAKNSRLERPIRTGLLVVGSIICLVTEWNTYTVLWGRYQSLRPGTNTRACTSRTGKQNQGKTVQCTWDWTKLFEMHYFFICSKEWGSTPEVNKIQSRAQHMAS